MKLTIERALLLKSLSHVQSIVERRNTMPILANLALRAADGRLALMASDMEVDVVERVECKIAAEGEITAPAHTLYEIVRKLPEGADIDIESSEQDQRLIMRAGRSRFTLPSLSIAEFPEIAQDALEVSFRLPALALKRMIDQTRFAMSNEETRYYLNGIYLHTAVADGVEVLRAVATDGHRLARVELPLPEGAHGMAGGIVPRKTVHELHKLIGEVEGEIHVEFSATRVRFSFGAIRLSSRLIDGAFPDYERVIPAGNDKLMTVERKLCTEAVDRVASISTEKSRGIKLSVDGSALVLSVSSAETGSATETLEVSYDATPLEIGFNSRYLHDILSQMDGSEARFAMSDTVSSVIVQDVDDASALYVLMPMRV